MRYEYFCPNCNFEKEVWHSIKDDPEILCDKCHTKMKRKITGGSVILYKYQTDVVESFDYKLDKEKDLIRSGLKPDPYAKWRDEPL